MSIPQSGIPAAGADSITEADTHHVCTILNRIVASSCCKDCDDPVVVFRFRGIPLHGSLSESVWSLYFHGSRKSFPMVLRCMLGEYDATFLRKRMPRLWDSNGKAPLTIDQIAAREIFFGKAAGCQQEVIARCVVRAWKRAPWLAEIPLVPDEPHALFMIPVPYGRKLLGMSQPGAELLVDIWVCIRRVGTIGCSFFLISYAQVAQNARNAANVHRGSRIKLQSHLRLRSRIWVWIVGMKVGCPLRCLRRRQDQRRASGKCRAEILIHRAYRGTGHLCT